MKDMNRHTQRMNKVLQFIDETLDMDVNIKSLAKMAFYSEYHFHRLFRTYVGESVYAYRKRLLLERALKFIQFTNKSITEIAFDSGYDNHSSFNKAFKKHFKHSPTQARQKMFEIDNYTFPDNYKGLNMKVKIIEIEDIPVIATRAVGRFEEMAAEAWGRMMKFAYGNKLITENVRRFGITHDDPNVTDSEKIRYDACLDIDADISHLDNFKKMIITGGSYATVMHLGDYNKLDESYGYLFNEWLPNSNYELRDAPCFDQYLNKDPRRTKVENLKTIIHIPIVRI